MRQPEQRFGCPELVDDKLGIQADGSRHVQLCPFCLRRGHYDDTLIPVSLDARFVDYAVDFASAAEKYAGVADEHSSFKRRPLGRLPDWARRMRDAAGNFRH